MSAFKTKPRIAIIGLGYVGLPLACALSAHFELTGFDTNSQRLELLKQNIDSTHEMTAQALKQAPIYYTDVLDALKGQDIYIVTVPTPIDADKEPDLSLLEKASQMIGQVMAPGSIVVFESTVYPGVTEDVCGPILARGSGLSSGQDFYLGYSPERINPGDSQHRLDVITKVVAGQTPEVTEYLAEIYGRINQQRIFKAETIKTAEAAKVIENAQRDINIAFINEISIIVNKMDLSIYAVLEAARTKWNFLDFKPGLVGGHCIGVDPYYLAHCARSLGHEPEVILSGRRTNESMGSRLADMIKKHLPEPKPGQSIKLLVLGLTFKENIPDLRNSKVVDLIKALSAADTQITVHDGHAEPAEAQAYYQIEIFKHLNFDGEFDGIIGAVAHHEYVEMDPARIKACLRPGGRIFDLKNIWGASLLKHDPAYWSL